MSSEKFQSKGGFILASIGAAVGLGNALRFPGLCAKYGGGAFLLIYSVALLALGLPILNAEIALGRKIKGGAPKCMKSLKKSGEGFGWASCVNSVFTAVIYAGLAGWIIATAATVVPLCLNAPLLTDTEISGYFFDTVLSARNDGVIDGFSFLVAGCILAAWVLMFLCLKGGAKSLSKAARFTVAIPITLLVFLAVRGLFYPTSSEALAALFIPDFSKLSSPELWLTALGQVFFSLSIVVGIMPAYGSYLPEGTNIFKCSLVIAAADFFVSVLASVVLFTTLYGCGLQEQIGASGIITAFTVYPVAITRLFGDCTALNAAVGVLFYSSLAMMAIQSAVSMLEAFLNPFSERGGKPKKKIAARICLIAAPVTLIFATTAAPVAVDISDRFINFYNVLILGIAECILIGASKKTGDLSAEINKFTRKLKMPKKPFGVSVAFLSPAVLISLTLYEVFRLCTAGLGYPLWLQIAFGWGLSAAVFALPLILNTKFTPRNIWRRNKLHP